MDKVSKFFSCFNGPSDESKCKYQNLTLSDAGTQAFVGQIITISSSFITLAADYLNLTDNYLLALNEGQCVIANGFYNVWYLLAAIMYLANVFGLSGSI